MTIKVRQVIQIPGGGGPPPPPKVTMSFSQQPTDTEVNQLFNPPVSVRISDRGQDVLVLTNNTGDCHINFEYATADANGIATFTALSAGDNPSTPEGCTVRIHNVSRPEVADIISNPFHVTAAETRWTLLNKAATETIEQGTRIVTLDTTGANLIVVACSFANVAPTVPIPSVFDNLGNTFELLSRFQPPDTAVDFYTPCIVADFVVNPITSTNTAITIPDPSGIAYIFVHVMAFSCSKTPAFVTESGIYDYATSVMHLPVTPIDFPQSLLITSLGAISVNEETTVIVPNGYTAALGINTISFAGLSTAYRARPTTGTENPFWLRTPPVNLAANLLVFRGV